MVAERSEMQRSAPSDGGAAALGLLADTIYRESKHPKGQQELPL